MSADDMKQRKWLITFGGPSEAFHKRVEIVCDQAYSIDAFDHIIGYTDKDLIDDTDFWSRHGSFIQNNERGYGYWIWKSYLTKKTLEQMSDNDIVVYIDAGCTINPYGKERLLEYFDLVNKSECGNLSITQRYSELAWTKSEIFNYYEVQNDTRVVDTNQLLGGVFVIRKCDHTVDLVNKWYAGCSNYQLIDDSISLTNHKSFRENRHDQSIFSIIRKKYGTITTEFNETMFAFARGGWAKAGHKYPIWATRIRTVPAVPTGHKLLKSKSNYLSKSNYFS